MSVVDPTSGKVLRTYKVGEEPEGVSVHPANGQVYVTSEDAGAVFVVDPAADRVLASIEVGPRPRNPSRSFRTARRRMSRTRTGRT